MARTDILLPTCNRLASLVMTLGVAAQTAHDVRVIVADQSTIPCGGRPGGADAGRGDRGARRRRRGITGLLHGIAEQRDFLLRQATAETVLYLDDDVLMETWVLERY